MREHDYLINVIYRLLGVEVKEDNPEFLQSLNWGEILFQSMSHRIVSILFNDLIETGMADRINNNVYRNLKMLHDSSLYKDNLMTVEANRICLKIKETDKINAVVSKGPILSNYLYPKRGLRSYGDIDLLTDRKSLTTLKTIIKSMGYVQGSIDKNQGKFIEASRQDIITKELASHETVEFHKQSFNYFLDNIVVDINHALTWKMSKGNSLFKKIDTNDFLGNKSDYKLDNLMICGLTPEFLFLHVCLHLYSEAILFCWQHSWYKNFGELELIKYIDVGLFFNKISDWEKINTLVSEMSLEIAVEFVITQFSQIFPKVTVPDDLKRYIKNSVEVDYYFTYRGEKKEWGIPITKRIFNQQLRLCDVKNNTRDGDIRQKYEKNRTSK